MHIVWMEDEDGDATDARYYCSDYCARTDDHYAGWDGCHELDYCTPCESCGAWIESSLCDYGTRSWDCPVHDYRYVPA